MALPMNWYRALAFLLLIVVFPTATFADAAPIRISFLNPGKHDEFFWPAVSAVMQAAADQFGYQLEIIYAERDAQAIGALGRQIITRADPPDVLVLVNEFQAGANLLKAADARGIKAFMLLNSFYGDEATAMGKPGEIYRHWIGSLVADNEAAGRRMGDALTACAHKTGTADVDGKFHVLALLGDSTTPASIDRTNGLHAAIAAHPDMILEREFNTNWQTPKGHDLTANFLSWAAENQVHTAGIWAANDALAMGAITAAEERQLQPGKDLCIVGLNWSPEGLDLVRTGKMAMTDGGHFLAGGWAMVMIHDYLVAQAEAPANTPHRALTFQMAPVDGNNVAEFFTKLGDRDWHRIDFKSFSRSGADSAGATDVADGPYEFTLHQTLYHAEMPATGEPAN